MAWVIPSGGLTFAKRNNSKLAPSLLAQTSALAEELIDKHFSLSSQEWRRLQYEIIPQEKILITIPNDALATLFLLQNHEILPRKRREFFGLALAEEKLVALGKSSSFLNALLLYIFTHELVHMVRFVRFCANFWMALPERLKEERRVHHLTKEVLSYYRCRELEKVIKHFDKIYT
ncbi:hypothetical protein [Thermodesulfatator atlanticus]|uniref:hypothetical protein n=1 Tax=Thermodesulfatator atlanticus TaxID=501497 RepID=UPI0003B68179|nr:hypothetical protein [Thermodesulfatator atlanticus]